MNFEADLNSEQIEAVRHGEGPQLVIAGAGSGKTRVITYRIAWLVNECGVEPYRIAAVTFTNKAAAEMKERVEELLDVKDGQRLEVFVGTFHRFALRLLRRYGERVGLVPGFTILDSQDQMALMKQALLDEGVDPTAIPPRAALSAVSGAKNKLLTIAEFEAEAQGYYEGQIAKAYRGYQRLLREGGAVDFDDMISNVVRLLEKEVELGDRMRERLRYLLVDEFQDTNYAQLRLIEAINGRAGNLTAVGDEDQSIYLWRGAQIENILTFEDYFKGAEVRKLERNYRSTQTILDASGGVIERNTKRRGKRLWTDAGAGEQVCVHTARDEGEEARWAVRTMNQLSSDYRYSDMAVLVRTNAQTRVLEDELLRRKIPYSLIAGVRFYERAEIKDLVAYLRVLRNPKDNLSLRRILNVPTRGIGKSTQDALFLEAENSGYSLWDVLQREQFGGVSNRAAAALLRFRDLVSGLQSLARRVDLYELLEAVIERTGFTDAYQRKQDEEAMARLENIKEFLSAAREFADDYEGLGLPLLQEDPAGTEEQQSKPGSLTPDMLTPDILTRDADGQAGLFDDGASSQTDFDPGGDDVLTAFLDYVSLVSDTDGLQSEIGVSLMTLHSAKGLEFPVVFLTGLEDGLLPHFNSETPEQMEEERRLLYVGMTRARERLFIGHCLRRRIAGRYQDQLPSPFIGEIPDHLVEVSRGADVYSARPYGGYPGSASRPSARSGVTEAAVLSFFQGTSAVDAASEPDNAPEDEDQSAFARSKSVVKAAQLAKPTRSLRPRKPMPSVAPPGVDDSVELRRGAGVKHPTLGPGVILAVEGEGDNAKLTVYFEKAGKRRLIARYASLEPL